MKTVIKTFLIFPLISTLYFRAQAQFLGGFFNQQSQQRKLMAAQIVQYEIYWGGLKTGYLVTKTGLNTAHDLKNGAFNLHNAYISSLSQVNPGIQNSPKGKAIAELKRLSLKLFADELSWQRQQKSLTATEISYLQKVGGNLAVKCQLDMDELLPVLTPGKLQLTDEQRMERLDQIYERMKDKYAFAGSFTAKCRKLAQSRQQNSQDHEQLKKLNGIQ